MGKDALYDKYLTQCFHVISPLLLLLRDQLRRFRCRLMRAQGCQGKTKSWSLVLLLGETRKLTWNLWTGKVWFSFIHSASKSSFKFNPFVCSSVPTTHFVNTLFCRRLCAGHSQRRMISPLDLPTRNASGLVRRQINMSGTAPWERHAKGSAWKGRREIGI